MRIALLFSLILVLSACAHSPSKDTEVPMEQVEIRLDLAERYLWDDEPRMALEQLRIIEGAATDNQRLHFVFGLAYTVLDDLPKAAASYRQSLEINPSSGEAWNNLGQVRQAMGQFEEAKQAYEMALQQGDYMTPEFAAFNLASLYAAQGQWDQALDWSSTGIEKNRRYIPLYEQSAEFFRTTERYQEAAKILEAGVEARPDNIRLKLMLAEELLSIGREQDAKKWFNRIIQRDPQSEEGRTAQHYLEILR
ncbi:MAG: tetratricopeptide repeat protein [Desulfonatronovibrio sp. MSAO_Bac4]|nr:MAG: tetratricopeptide repeat protein [Desulfonatronovibrio sp. MSAO_Bac4]